MEMKKTLVLGASIKPHRYSNLAIKRLLAKDHEVIAYGFSTGKVDNIEIVNKGINDMQSENIHTITLYLRPEIQTQYKVLIKELLPKRVIFNPGTENPEFMHELNVLGIDAIEACTLVMLNTNQF